MITLGLQLVLGLACNAVRPSLDTWVGELNGDDEGSDELPEQSSIITPLVGEIPQVNFCGVPEKDMNR